jgi:hypothetical protein
MVFSRCELCPWLENENTIPEVCPPNEMPIKIPYQKIAGQLIKENDLQDLLMIN